MVYFISMWIVCFVLCYGLLFAWCQRGSEITNYREDFIFSIIISFFGGIFSLIVIILLLCLIEWKTPFKYGLKFW